ncbi:hypothetical protein GCM10023115_29640 [Pontixanthobacter gangjinensis]|uniref:Glycosyltransferase family 4 protein n=1 Tax=Christiangramia aestuarii TaxID=1028746 RepID=A0A7K1LN16_9FLAO|nr:glycosyltransferase family 4 protein [Christiangramia aestuarii]MUP42196.1 glycosyltransferase family 4 protein [Christiangramia aestuarii]
MIKKTFCFIQQNHISERGGGAEVQALYLSQQLAKSGFIVNYICRSISSQKAFTKSIIDDVVVHWLPNKPLHSIANLRLIYKTLVKIDPDYIVERMSSSFGLSAILYKNDHQKFIWICTDNNAPRRFKNIRNSFQKLNFAKIVYNFPASLSSDFARQIAIKYADVAFTQNNVQENILLQQFGKKSQRMVSGHPRPEVVIQPEKRFHLRTVLWCGNLGSHKRPELFIELARIFEKSDLKFLMVGGHSDVSYCKSLFKNKPSNLDLTGQVSFGKALEYFDEAAILINTSTSEGFSNTYIQAWLRGIPTIVMGADPDNVIEKNNLGYDIDTIEAAAKKISLLLGEEDAYSAISKNVQSYANLNHTIEVMVENFLRQINENSALPK